MSDEAKLVAEGYAALEATLLNCRAMIIDELRASDPAAWARANIQAGDALLEYNFRREFTYRELLPNSARFISPGYCFEQALKAEHVLTPSEIAYAQSQQEFAIRVSIPETAKKVARTCRSIAEQLSQGVTPNVASLVFKNMAESIVTLLKYSPSDATALDALRAAHEAVSRSNGASILLRWQALIALSHAAAAQGRENGDLDEIDEAIAAAQRAIALMPRSKCPERWAAAQLALGEALAVRADRVAPSSAAPKLQHRTSNVISAAFGTAKGVPTITADLKQKFEEAADVVHHAMTVLDAHATPLEGVQGDQGLQCLRSLGAVLVDAAAIEGSQPSTWLRERRFGNQSNWDEVNQARWAREGCAIAVTLHPHPGQFKKLSQQQVDDILNVLRELSSAALTSKAAALALAEALEKTEYKLRSSNADLRPAIQALRNAIDQYNNERLAIYYAELAGPGRVRDWKPEMEGALKQILLDAESLDSEILRVLWIQGQTRCLDRFAGNLAKVGALVAEVHAYAEEHKSPKVYGAWLEIALKHLQPYYLKANLTSAVELLDQVSRCLNDPEILGGSNLVSGVKHTWFRAVRPVHRLLIEQRDFSKAAALRGDMLALSSRKDTVAGILGWDVEEWCHVTSDAIESIRLVDLELARDLFDSMEKEASRIENEYRRRDVLERARNQLNEQELRNVSNLSSEKL